MFPHSDWEDDKDKHGLTPPTPYLHYLKAEWEKVVNRVGRDEWNQRRRDLTHLAALERQVNKDGSDAWQVSKLASRHDLRMPPWAGKLLEEIEANYFWDERIKLDVALGFRGSRKKGNKKGGRRMRDIYARALEGLCREVWGLELLAVPITEACKMVACRAKAEHRGEGLVVLLPNLNADSLRHEYYRWKKREASDLAAVEPRAKPYLEKNRGKHLAKYRA